MCVRCLCWPPCGMLAYCFKSPSKVAQCSVRGVPALFTNSRVHGLGCVGFPDLKLPNTVRAGCDIVAGWCEQCGHSKSVSAVQTTPTMSNHRNIRTCVRCTSSTPVCSVHALSVFARQGGIDPCEHVHNLQVCNRYDIPGPVHIHCLFCFCSSHSLRSFNALGGSVLRLSQHSLVVRNGPGLCRGGSEAPTRSRISEAGACTTKSTRIMPFLMSVHRVWCGICPITSHALWLRLEVVTSQHNTPA